MSLTQSTNLRFGEMGLDYRLEHVICLYQEHNGTTNTAATIHDVHLGPGFRPEIQSGRSLTITALETMMARLGHQVGTRYLPPNLLATSRNSLVWWCPAGRRRLWFNPSHTHDQAKAVKALNGKFAHHPALLFLAHDHSLNVFALAENTRPIPTTKLFQAPYWNLSQGHMCNGNLKLPPCVPDQLAGFENAFFNSAFTHTSVGRLTRHPGGHEGLWTELTKVKTPPNPSWWRKHLRPTLNTLQSTLASLGKS